MSGGPACRACQTRSGVSGNAVRRTSIARAIALAMAGAVGIRPLSPMPLDPWALVPQRSPPGGSALAHYEGHVRP